MADVFISYAREDSDAVRELVKTLEQEGFSVFWDRDMAIGAEFEFRLEQALAEARAVVVVWSANSVGSPWVRGEAHDGLDRQILVPVRLDESKLPLAFRGLEAAHLEGWPDRARNIEMRKVLEGIRSLISQPDQPNERLTPIRDDPTISRRVAERVVRALGEDRINQRKVEAILTDAAFAMLRGALPALVSRQFIDDLARLLSCSVAVMRSTSSGRAVRIVDLDAQTDDQALDRILGLPAGDGVRVILGADEELVLRNAAWCLRIDSTQGVQVALVCTESVAPPSFDVVRRLSYAAQFLTLSD
jgi:hypothetical protein